MARLSKSRVIAGLQCEKRLWMQVHKPEECEAVSVKAFEIGNNVGEVARSLYPQGIMVGFNDDIGLSLNNTKRLLSEHQDVVLFEAAFSGGGITIFADIVEKKASDLAIIEVKSSTQAKEHHINDVAIQAWVMRQAGHEPTCIKLRHIDNSFVYPGNGKYDGLFADEVLTETVQPLFSEIPGWNERFSRVADSIEEPAIEPGVQCENPYPYQCEFYKYCTRNLPTEPEYPVTLLPRNSKTEQFLIESGYKDLRDVPENLLSEEKHLRIWRATKTGKPELSAEAGKTMAAFGYPRYYLDFEGINFAIPIWEGVRPYQQIPFQFSCHIEKQKGVLDHTYFLHTTQYSPLHDFTEALIKAVGTDGPIFVYNAAYENTIIRQLSVMVPEYTNALKLISERIVDLLPIAREHYYHPAMKGSWSIKAVLPTIVPELDYSNLEEVADGGAAQEAFIEIISPDTLPDRKQQLIKRMIEYCNRDTLALVALANYLKNNALQMIKSLRIDER